MTKREMFAVIRNYFVENGIESLAVDENTAVLSNDGEREMPIDKVLGFIDHEVELLASKKSSSKPTKVQIENESIKTAILDTLKANGKGMTVTQIMGANAELPQSNQKITSLLTQLKTAHLVDKTVEKKVSYYFIVED